MTSETGRPSPAELTDASWFKAQASSANGGCLEVAFVRDWVALRDNEDPQNPPFVVTQHVWSCWLDGAKNGEFDRPVS